MLEKERNSYKILVKYICKKKDMEKMVANLRTVKGDAVDEN